MRLACLSVFVLLITSFCAAQSPRPLGPAPTVWLSQESTSTVNNSIGVDTGGIYWDDLFGSKTYFKNLATSAAVAAGYLPLTAGAGAALTGILAANEGVSVDGTTRISGTGVGSLAAGSTVDSKPIAVTTADNDFSTTQTQYGLAVEGPGGGLVLKVHTGEIRIDQSATSAADYDESWYLADTTLTLQNTGTVAYWDSAEESTVTLPASLLLSVDGRMQVGEGAAANGPGANAVGNGATATGDGSTALGPNSTAAAGALALQSGNAGASSVAIKGTASNGGWAIGGTATGSNAMSLTQTGEATGNSSLAGPGNIVSGQYATGFGPSNLTRGYAAHNHSDNSTVDSLTGGAFAGGHNYIHNKGTNIAGPYSGDAGADSVILGGAYNVLQALRGAMISAFDGDNYSDYSLLIGLKPKASDAHDGVFVMKGNQGDDTTDTTGPNQALFYPDAPGSGNGGQLAIKGQPDTTSTLTVWGGQTVHGDLSMSTGTLKAATVRSAYKSSDGSTGWTGAVEFVAVPPDEMGTLTVKNGIITSVNVP